MSDEEDNLPATLSLVEFSAARRKEIEIMTNSLKSNGNRAQLAFQKLPKHMRRRVMSHNVKRLPRRLREIHSNQMKKSGLPPKQKRPSRKYRRRPRNLTEEYVRRQRRIRWLRTHLWHAKRFHMVEKWGYKLPLSPCDKSFRACYRASAYHCLLQDVSYYNCVEIRGSFTVLAEGFKKVTKTSSGLTFTANVFIHGKIEGYTTLYRFDNANKAIGTVKFIWKPCDNNKNKVIWLWLHPAFYKEALDTLIMCFNLKLIDSKYCSDTNEFVELIELKDELSRFKLIGPLSTAVLAHALKLTDLKETVNDVWIQTLNQTTVDSLQSVHEYWIKLQSETSPPGIILPLIVEDPRFTLPKIRTKAVNELENVYPDFDVELYRQLDVDSPIWDFNIRKVVGESKISQAKFNEMRAAFLVPGSEIKEKSATIPVLLVQNSPKGSRRCGYSSGWDIIFPSTWCQPFWLSFIMWGGRVGGLRETDLIKFESDELEILCPDTLSGSLEEKHLTLECKEKFFKLPPNKRTNYNKFNVTSPFEFNWKLLINEWNSGQEVSDFTVLRDKKLLRILKEILRTKMKKSSPFPIPENCLIPVIVNLVKKGPCKKFALICLPMDGDLKKEPIEPNKLDPNEKLRKKLRNEHKLLLKRLRRRRVKAKRNGKKAVPVDKNMLKNYTEKMRQLWLPETKTIRNSCSREVIGFIKQGDFCYSLGKSKGIGYITSEALKILLNQKVRNKVLVRNINSKQFRLSNIDIICD